MSNEADRLIVLREWLARLWGTVRRTRRDADLEEELRLHLELAAEDERRRGASPGQAARAAALKAGHVSQAIDYQRDQRALPWLEDLWRDLVYAGRTLARARGFTAAAVLSLGLGTGATTAIFTLIDAVLFRTVPVEHPERLYFIGHDPGPDLELSSNYPILERYRTAPVFSGVTAYRPRTFRVRTSEGAEGVPGQYVSGNYHAVVGAPMALGRGFSSEADRQPGGSRLAIVSYDYWTARLGGGADVLGKTLTVDDRAMTIVGVTARGFHGLNPGEHSDVTLPMSVMALDEPAFFGAHDGWVGQPIVARLAPGVSAPQALAATDALFHQFVEEPANRWVKRANRDRFRAAALVPAARGTFALRHTYARPLWVLMAMVAVLLSIACTNVAVLQLARSADRRQEIALRLSIGGSRSRLVRQLLTDSVALAALGGLAGLFVAVWGTGAILSLFAVGPSPAAIDATVNSRVLAAATAVVVIAAVGFGLVPAFRSTRVDLAPALKDGTLAIHGAPRPAIGRTLVIAQIALCMVLVAAAGLLSRSLRNLQRFDAGFTRDHLLLADVDLGGASLPPERRLAVFFDLLDRAARMEGVRSAALSWRTPIDFSSQLGRIDVPGFRASPEDGVSSNIVTAGYFQTFGLNVIRGRAFSDRDRSGTARVAVVSQSMARHFFGASDPIGRTFVLGSERDIRTIVGVVDDARHEELRTAAPPRMVYVPLSQMGGSDPAAQVPDRLAVSLRTPEDPASLAWTVRREVWSIRKDAMVPYVRTMTEQIDATLIPERLLTTLSTWFAGAALVLACVGLYGVVAYSVARRRREIGLRMALGALPGAILWRVLREVLALSAIGVGLGLAIAVPATRLLSTFLFGVPPHDAATLIGTTGVMLAVALLAGVIPARRAAAIDPAGALRSR